MQESTKTQELEAPGIFDLSGQNELLSENTLVLKYTADLIEDLNRLKQAKHLFNTIIIDTSDTGFYFAAETLIEVANISKDILSLQGTLLFIAADKAAAIVKESGLGLTSLQIFHNFSEVYDYSPALVRDIERVLGASAQLMQGSTSLSEQILLSSIPVLTYFGIKLKANMDSSKNRNTLLAAIDNYTPLSTIIQRLSTTMLFEETLDEVRALDEIGAIYPIFAKIPFLVNCFRNQIAFDLKDYLVETNLIDKDRLEQIILSQQVNKSRRPFSLGTLCVANDIISSRQLEIALQDISYYGQPTKIAKNEVNVKQEEESKIKTLVGYLGNTDAAGLLQSLSNNRETGVLSVEHQSMLFRAILAQGKLTHCQQGKLKGNEAIIEFVSTWKQGVFVFIERQPPPDLSGESYKTTIPLERLLMDAALASDNIEAIWKKLPSGSNTTLERVEDSQGILKNNNLLDANDNTPIGEVDLEIMKRLYREFDGLTSINTTIKRISDISNYKAAMAINRLSAFNLVRVPSADLHDHIDKFQQLIKKIANIIGLEQNIVFLRLSLQAAQGYSTRLRLFTVGPLGEIGFDLSFARQAHYCLADIAKFLNEWQTQYLDYMSKELDKLTLEDIKISLIKTNPR